MEIGPAAEPEAEADDADDEPEPISLEVVGDDDPETDPEAEDDATTSSIPTGVPGPGWHSDPLDPARRLRWWTGSSWTARVVTLEVGSEAISWHHRIEDHGAPSSVELPPLSPSRGRVVDLPDELEDVDETVAALDGDVDGAENVVRGPWAHRRRLVAIAAVAAVLIAGIAGAGAAMFGGDERPTVEPATLYRDEAAGFSLRYPDGWRVQTRTSGEGVRFEIGARGSAPDDQNTVSVVVGTESAPLPPLHLLAEEVTTRLVERFPDIRLEVAERTRLADSAAYRIELADGTSDPPTRVVQVVGRTTNGRPLTVTMTIREPRTAPSAREFDEFLESIRSG